jgi:hypothetical protein
MTQELHAVSMAENINAYKILIDKPKERKQLSEYMFGLEDKINMDFMKI